ncbi:septation ring formation regulator EzrA [Mesobacillus zeae]|uniref:Septation ring formation regulator EzrA n=1 Tax=Mesobacillus zeae TaxID=1917180 RepID=A0A398B5T9_9BACI|nr:septation ring formation regulator EzrA [Mesobacillus zeae]RID83126.1 septation ring formation regulator EzrA [Mesobacillus zeae]
MEYIIGGIVLIMGLFLAGFLLKRKYFGEVDRYEAWKLDILNRPVLEEMSKVKQLNMTGQTEELFERWRREWDEIVTVGLPGIEENLFDAEEYSDKLRFRKAKETFSVMESKLNEIEEVINKILSELNELVGSEEKNRSEIEGLKELYRGSRKNLLAHRHSFGKAEENLEQQLDEVNAKFVEFDEKTMNGDYLEARETVLTINGQLEQISIRMNIIPQLLHECQTVIPSQINDLKEGYKEMEGQGYSLEHIGFDAEMKEIEKGMDEFHTLIYGTEIGKVEQGIEKMKEAIDSLFDLLENEVAGRQSIMKAHPAAEKCLDEAVEEQERIHQELQIIQESYHLNEKELDAQRSCDGQLDELVRRFELLSAKIQQSETAQSFLNEELLKLKEELDSVISDQLAFKEKLNALRKDELAAREQVKELSRQITEMIRLVSKSNLPGLSQTYKDLLEDARESIQNVAGKLEDKPLDIPVVQQHLEIAVLTVEKLSNTTTEMVENVMLAEKVIQYGNRYRSKHQSVAKGLMQAEESFRSYDYRRALEEAATAIEKVEPGALKKIEELIYEKQA